MFISGGRLKSVAACADVILIFDACGFRSAVIGARAGLEKQQPWKLLCIGVMSVSESGFTVFGMDPPDT
jgi:hypothetical protein